MPTPDEINAYRALRGRFLNGLWDMEKEGLDNPGIGVSVDALIERIGDAELADQYRRRLVNNLIDDGLVVSRPLSMGRAYPREVMLTSFGRPEVERWIEDDAPTDLIAIPPSQVFTTHFHGNVTGSPVVVGSTNTTVNMQTAVGEQLSTLVAKAKELLISWNHFGEEREDVESDIDILEEEISNPSNNSGRIRSALRRLANWAAVTATQAATTELSGEVQHLTHEVLQAIT
jgi:hypothetical protein